MQGNKVSILRDRALNGRFSFFAMDMEYHRTTTTKVLDLLDALIKGFSQKYREIWLSGSSHGGYVFLNFLKFYRPDSVKKVFLFAPSYSTLSLTLQKVGEENCREWLEGRKELMFTECETGLELVVHKDFATDIVNKGYELIQGKEVPFPEKVPYELYVFHGTKDEVVPVEHSRLFVSKVRVRVYRELEDDHRLTSSFGALVEQFM